MKFVLALFILLNVCFAQADDTAPVSPELTAQQRKALAEAMDPLSDSIRKTVEDMVKKDPKSLVITEGTYDGSCGCLVKKVGLTLEASHADDLLHRVQDIKERLTVYHVGDHATITIDVRSARKGTIQFKKTF